MNQWLTPVVKNYKRFFGESKRPVVWEVGSRDGHDAAELAERIYDGATNTLWDNAVIVAIEPNPDQAEAIEQTYPKMRVLRFAASNKVALDVDFMVYHGDEGAVGSSSLNLTWKGDDLEGHIIKVNTARLDDYIDEDIDIMKINVEGHSPEVLEGLADKIDRIKVMHIETEKWSGTDKKVEQFMKRRGWFLVDETEQYGGMPDQVWVNSGFLFDLEE